MIFLVLFCGWFCCVWAQIPQRECFEVNAEIAVENLRLFAAKPVRDEREKKQRKKKKIPFFFSVFLLFN
jgi:hypothetical protein